MPVPYTAAHTPEQTMSFVKQDLFATGLDEGHLERLIGSLAAAPIDWGDLYLQKIEQESYALEEGIVKRAHYSVDQGAAVRVNQEERTGFAYSNELFFPALAQAMSAAVHIANGPAAKRILVPTMLPKVMRYGAQNPISGGTAADKVALLQWADTLARKMDARVVDVQCSISGRYEKVLIVGLDGQQVADCRPHRRLTVRVVMVDAQGRRESGSAGLGTRAGVTFSQEEVRATVERAIHEGSVNLEARPAPAGVFPVVLGAGMPGGLLHEAVGHGLEGDFNRKGSSVYSEKIGQRVASPLCTIVDDGTLNDRSGTLWVDDEGIPCQRNVLIEDGILKGYLQDRLNARLMNQQPTGNGRRENYASPPMPRMTNTFMLPGQHNLEEIIASVKDGIYAVNFSGGQVDITSGDFVFSTSEAYRIENGKITYPIKGATLIGNGPDTMNKVSMVGNDLALDYGIGVCCKNGQTVPVGVGQPSLLISSMTVGGTEHAK
ncbi:MAG: metalloprotease TldD [Pseudomonadota bacterium]